MKRLGLVVIAVLCIILQLSLLPALRPFGVVPNVALVLVILVGLEGPASLAVMVAVIGGLALDLASGTNFGLWTGVLALAALAAGLLRRAGIELAGGSVAVVMVAAGTLVMSGVMWLTLIPVTSHWPMGLLVGHLLMELVLNLLVILILRPIIHRVVPSTTADEVAVR